MNKLTITDNIKSKIYTIRGQQVMFDRDLARLYQVETKVFNQAVKRNIDRFPDDFMFQITKEELNDSLRSQNVTLKNSRGQHIKYLPYVFTEQGVSMLSAILRSDRAVNISIEIIRAFVSMRKIISQNALIFKKFEHIEQKLLKNDENFIKIFKALENKDTIQTQGIFYNGQIFDAHKFILDIIRSAKNNIILIDGYIDDNTLILFSKNQNIDVTIYTHKLNKELKLDLEKYNKQYRKITIKTNKKFHDRFLIIDNKEVYHIGASLKDLGKKVFGFSKMEDVSKNIIDFIQNI